MIGARLDFLARMAGHQGAISLVAASLRFNWLAVLGFPGSASTATSFKWNPRVRPYALPHRGRRRHPVGAN
jgi:hypothetical protein